MKNMTADSLLVILGKEEKSPSLTTSEETEYFLKSRITIPVEHSEAARAIRLIEEKYFEMVGGQLGYKSLVFLREINMRDRNAFAVECLLEAVDEQGLTSGDKRIIRDIALNSFHTALEFALTPSGRHLNLADCVRVDLHWGALNELERYGFRVSTSRCNDKWFYTGNLN